LKAVGSAAKDIAKMKGNEDDIEAGVAPTVAKAPPQGATTKDIAKARGSILHDAPVIQEEEESNEDDIEDGVAPTVTNIGKDEPAVTAPPPNAAVVVDGKQEQQDQSTTATTPTKVAANNASPATSEEETEVAGPVVMEIDELYMDLKEIAAAHPESHVDVEDVEDSQGLTSEEAAARLEQNGKNVLTPPAKMPEWKRFLLQFRNMFMILLNSCAVLSLLAFVLQGNTSDMTNLYLAIVLFVVVFLTCFLQFHEEGKANNLMDSFSKMLAVKTTVLRDDKEKEVPVEEVVVGDLVVIKDGDKVPADLVLLLCRGLKSECASLTGESEPISCSDTPSKPGTRLFECDNIAFSSSLCFDGSAIGIVVRTGDKTVRRHYTYQCNVTTTTKMTMKAIE
jgi:magnesium-transporting ATPase (P-type)